jgi:hypothetical protein
MLNVSWPYACTAPSTPMNMAARANSSLLRSALFHSCTHCLMESISGRGLFRVISPAHSAACALQVTNR